MRTHLRAGALTVAVALTLASVTMASVVSASPASASSRSHVTLNQWAARYGHRFDSLMQDAKNLDNYRPNTVGGVLNRMTTDAAALRRTPAPSGQARAFHTMTNDFYKLGTTGFAIIVGNNKKQQQKLVHLAHTSGVAAGRFAAVFFAAGVPLGRFHTAHDLIHFFRS